MAAMDDASQVDAIRVLSSPSSAGVVKIAADEGKSIWFSGDVYTIKLASGDTGGSLGFGYASVPPSGGPPLHYHARSDEFFYVLSGQVDFSENDNHMNAGPGDLIYIKRGARHRFHNGGIYSAELLFFYSPGGPEGLFVEGGEEPQPGVAPPPWGMEKFAGDFMASLFKKYDQNILGL